MRSRIFLISNLLVCFFTLPLESLANEAADEAVSIGVAVYESEICQEYKNIHPLKDYWSVIKDFSKHQAPEIAVDAQIRQSDNPIAACSFHAGWAIGAFMSAMGD